MKKLLICLALLCIFPLIFSACFSKRNGGSDDPGDFADHGGAPMEFQHFSLSESGMSAQSYVYEGYKTGDWRPFRAFYPLGILGQHGFR